MDLIATPGEDDSGGIKPLHRAFAIEYVENGFNAREAARVFGYDPAHGNRIKRIPEVAAFIEKLANTKIAANTVYRQQLDAMLDRMEDIAFGDVDVPLMTTTGEQLYGRHINHKMIVEVYKARLNQLAGSDAPGEVSPTQVVFTVVDKRKNA